MVCLIVSLHFNFLVDLLQINETNPGRADKIRKERKEGDGKRGENIEGGRK